MSFLKYLGHSAFYFGGKDFGFLIDPWILHNPESGFQAGKDRVDQIFLTHAHGDHYGDTEKLASKTGTTVVSVVETAAELSKKGFKTLGVNFGSDIKFPWGNAQFFPATHTSSFPDGRYAGMPAGILFKFNDGFSIYHAGDTGLNSELELIGKLYSPDIALLPIGGFYTMGINEAVTAAEMLRAKTVIPVHYNTFDVIKADPFEFKSLVEGKGIKCFVMNSGEELKFDGIG